MRYLLVLAALVFVSSPAVTPTATASAKQGRATAAYRNRTVEMAHRAIDAELFKYPERLVGVSMRMTYRIDTLGHVRDVKIVSGHRDRWAEKTAQRVLSALKLPPVPNDVLRELGMDHIEAESTWAYYTQLPRSNQSLEPTADRRENPNMTTSTHRLKSKRGSVSSGSAPSR